MKLYESFESDLKKITNTLVSEFEESSKRNLLQYSKNFALNSLYLAELRYEFVDSKRIIAETFLLQLKAVDQQISDFEALISNANKKLKSKSTLDGSEISSISQMAETLKLFYHKILIIKEDMDQDGEFYQEFENISLKIERKVLDFFNIYSNISK